MGDRHYRGSAEATHWSTLSSTDPLASGSERSYELRAKYLRISVHIYDKAICLLNVLNMVTEIWLTVIWFTLVVGQDPEISVHQSERLKWMLD